MIPKLLSYIKEQVDAGKSWEVIQQSLRNQGWEENDIEEAAYVVFNPSATKDITKKPSITSKVNPTKIKSDSPLPKAPQKEVGCVPSAIITFIVVSAFIIIFLIFSGNSSQQTQQVQEQASTPTSLPTSTPLPTPTPVMDLPAIIKFWRPRIALIVCDFRYTNNNQLYARGRGSGIALLYTDGIKILTNRHVTVDENGYGAAECAFKFPDHDQIFSVSNKDILSPTDGTDWATLRVTTPDSYLTDLTNKDAPICQNKIDSGEDIVILGYPAYAGLGASDITSTDGRISGYQAPYYTTEAKIEQGNSGGAAISIKENCYMGIPTRVFFGQFENLGGILDVKYVLKQQ